LDAAVVDSDRRMLVAESDDFSAVELLVECQKLVVELFVAVEF
jgi:hypothetical protein